MLQFGWSIEIKCQTSLHIVFRLAQTILTMGRKNAMTEMKNFNEKIIEEFRANNGQVAMFADYPMIILHTVGSRSGKTFLVPLVLTIKDDEMLLFASFAGAKKHPAWVFNLRANPEITVEVGDESFAALVVELNGGRRRKSTVQRQADVSEQFAKYVESAAPRDIPVFRIDRV